MKRVLVGLSLFALAAQAFGQQGPSADPVVVYKAAADYEFVVESVKAAVVNRGMLVSGTLHVNEMLNRTAEDLGLAGQPYLAAESVEFCSAVLSQRMTRADPRNLVICPFTVAIYVPSGEPEQAYVAFRRHQLAGASAAVEQEVFELLDGIAREASE